VGLLLGTTPQARFDRITNYFFIYRIDAAEQLYKAGKIEKILISGDENSLDGINETECMRDSLVARGVPASAIILDGKGYRTINSILNARNIYGLRSFTIISQEFHNEGALYQAKHLGLDFDNMQAYNAKMPRSRRAYITSVREYFARVKMFIDLMINDYENSKIVPDTQFDNSMSIVDSTCCDSFTVVYRQPVNGYKVKATIKMEEYEINNADITFIKDKKSFALHTTSFGDSTFNKGGWGMLGENQEIMEKYRGKTLEIDYHITKVDWKTMPDETPFFFIDLDFDGIEELVIVHQSMGVRYHDGYDVYRIVEGRPVLIDYPPYNDWREVCGFGMTDYPEFDYKKKTISCPYPEGELTWDGRTIYGISKTQKDTVVVDGRKYFFNHLEVIEEIKYDENE
jgi:vancomycin permeability regulator SanA